MLEIRGLSPSLCLLSLLLVLHGAERSQPPPRRRFEYKLSFKGPRLAVPGAGIPFWSHHGGEEQRRTRHVQGPPECWRACSQRDSGCEGLYSRGNTEVTVPGPGPPPSQTCLLLPQAQLLCLFVKDPEAPAEQAAGYVGQHRVTAKEKGKGSQGSGERGQMDIDQVIHPSSQVPASVSLCPRTFFFPCFYLQPPSSSALDCKHTRVHTYIHAHI